MRTSTFILFLTLIIPFNSFAQSIFIDKGSNAALLGVAAGYMEEAFSYSAGGGFSLKGKTDFTLSYLGNNIEEDLKLNTFILGVEHLLLKQQPGTPINVHIGTNYRLGSLSSDILVDQGVEVTNNGWGFMGGISRSFGQSFKFIPFANIEHQRLTYKATYMGDTESETNSGMFYTIGAHLGINIKNNILALNPYLSFGEANSAGLRLSFILAGL